MDNKIIGVKGDSGKIQEFHFDQELMRGLYLAYDDNVVKNCKNFSINLDKPSAGQSFNTKMSKREDIVFITIKTKGNTAYQYFVSKDVDMMEVINVSNDVIPSDFKSMILEAQKMGSINTVDDLFK